MQIKRTIRFVGLAILLTLLVASGSTMAGPAIGKDNNAAQIQLAGTVTSQISYQGRLADAQGNPMNGTFNMVFQLWNAASGGQILGAGDIVKNNVPVSDGLFTVQLDVPHDAFNGQGLWLQIKVGGQTLSPRQALLPVPYALSLRPGASITSPGPDTLHVGNEGAGWAVEAWSRNNIALLGTNGPGGGSPPSGMHGVHGIGAGVGVYGQGGHTGVYGNGTSFGVKGDSSAGDGVTGETTAANKAGVYGHNANGAGIRGRSENSDGIVGWTGSTSYSGVFGNGDAGVGVTGRSTGNDGVVGVTTSTLPGNAGVRARNEGGGPAVFSEGDLYVTGALRGDVGPNNGGPFPRPAWDSGWVPVPRGFTTFAHNLGGNVDSYVIDMWCKDDNANVGINKAGYTGDAAGASWVQLTGTSLLVRRYGGDDYCDWARVRIWVIR